MRPRERRETGEQDLFRSRLDQIIDMKHPLVTLGRWVGASWKGVSARSTRMIPATRHCRRD
jgi:hypothetical protein